MTGQERLDFVELRQEMREGFTSLTKAVETLSKRVNSLETTRSNAEAVRANQEAAEAKRAASRASRREQIATVVGILGGLCGAFTILHNFGLV